MEQLKLFSSNNIKKQENKQKNLSFKELESQLKILINILGGLLDFCRDKTELATFLASVANEFLTEEDQVNEASLNSSEHSSCAALQADQCSGTEWQLLWLLFIFLSSFSHP